MSRKSRRRVEAKAEPADAVLEPAVVSEPVVETLTLKQVAAMFPEATVNLTQQWYGEEFYPKYTDALRKLKQLAK